MRNLGKLAGKVLAAIALAACLAPATAFADEAVSFGGDDIAAGNQVYLGSWDSTPISWDVEGASGGLAVHSTYILFKTQIDEAPDYDYNPNLTLETSELYTHSGEGLWFTTLPMFKSRAFSGGESALPGDFALSGDFGGATFPDGTEEWYWINEPLIHNTTFNCFDGTAVAPFGVRFTNYVYFKLGVRPASSFNLSSVLFSSAAEGGKSGAAGAGNFSALSGASSVSAWKFTLKDSSRSISASATSTTAAEGYSSWTVPVTFSGGGTASNDYVSAILCDANGSALYYGTVANAKASGTQDMTMPAGLAAGTYTLKVFSEQRNGDKATDYAGDFASITLTVEAAPVEYTITFINDDGSELQSGKVAEGETPKYEGDEPTKPSTDEYTYTFKGWSPEIAPVTGDATYTATYEATPVPAKKAVLKFDLAGGTLDGKTGTITIEATVGETINLPAAPTRDGYTFKCWKGSEYKAGAEYVVPEGGHEFTAEWEKNTDGTPSDTKPVIPATGDNNGMLILMLSIAALGSLYILAASIIKRRRDS